MTFTFTHLLIGLAAAATQTAMPAAAFNQTAGSVPDPSGVVATFEGEPINLSISWGDAHACAEIDATVTCYRTEADMDAAIAELSTASTPAASSTAVSDTRQAAFRVGPVAFAGGIVTAATCSTSLRLYRSTSYTGSVLLLTSRSIIHNMSTYGFDNDVSSYKVGACSSTFWAGANGSGTVYTGATDANDQAATMGGGWDNVVSSVRID